MGGGMNEVVEIAKKSLLAVANMINAEKELLQQPQVDCPVVHHFGPNLCIREVFMPAGTLAIGHKQKFDHMNIMLSGKVMVVDDNGNTNVLTAPMIFVGKPGRKIGYVLEDMVWQNIYATDLKDVEAVENYFIEKSESWLENYQDRFKVEHLTRTPDRDDYLAVLLEHGVSHETARTQAENTDDQIHIDCGIIKVADSPIEGKGLFLTASVKAGDVICQARIEGKRTQAGRYTNHSMSPNAKFVMADNGDIYLVAIKDISGCAGGQNWDEVTVCYRQALSLARLR
jgi:hypothetical protein